MKIVIDQKELINIVATHLKEKHNINITTHLMCFCDKDKYVNVDEIEVYNKSTDE